MKIDFCIDTPHGCYCDALYVDDATDEATIEDMKQERVNNWIAIITAPPPSKSKYQRDENGNLILDENGDPIPIGA